MKIHIVHDARQEQYSEGEYYSKIYGAFTDPDKAKAHRDWMNSQPNMPWMASITEVELNMS